MIAKMLHVRGLFIPIKLIDPRFCLAVNSQKGKKNSHIIGLYLELDCQTKRTPDAKVQGVFENSMVRVNYKDACIVMSAVCVESFFISMILLRHIQNIMMLFDSFAPLCNSLRTTQNSPEK